MNKNVTKTCKHCQSEIHAGAKVCPNCRKKQGIKIWQIILIVFVVVGVIGAVTGKGSSKPTSGGSDASDSKTPTEKKEFAQNEIVTYKNVNYIVTNVTKTTGIDYDNAKSGHEYVIVAIKIENNSDEKISYNSLDWKMENSNGREENTTFTIVDSDTALHSGELNAGGNVEGTITFEEAKGDTGLKLNYYDNVFDKESSFKIKID